MLPYNTYVPYTVVYMNGCIHNSNIIVHVNSLVGSNSNVQDTELKVGVACA